MKMRGVALLLMAALLVLIGITSPAGEEVSAAKPNAYFTYSPEDPVVDEPVTFNASLSSGDNLQYHWDFGGGDVETGMIVNHTFERYGTHQVTLIVTNSTGGFAKFSKAVHVKDEVNPADVIPIFGFMLVYLLFYLVLFLFIALIWVFYAANIVMGCVFAYKIYRKGKKTGHSEEVQPYFIAHLIATGVSLLMVYFSLVSIIAHIVIHLMYRSKLRQLVPNNADERPKKKGAASKKAEPGRSSKKKETGAKGDMKPRKAPDPPPPTA